MVDFSLPYKPHFGVQCPECKEACVTEITGEQLTIAKKDPVAALLLLSEDDRKECLAFFDKHEKLGHSPEATLLEMAPLPKA